MANKQRIVVTGATGFLGQKLCAELIQSGHHVATLTRDAGRAQNTLGPSVTTFAWDKPETWQSVVADADAIFHLAGESVAGERWTPEYKEKILKSRVETTRAIVEARPKGVLVSTSATGWYGDKGDRVVNEDEPEPGNDFLGKVCAAWENEAIKAEATAKRVVRARIGVVLGKDGGALQEMLNPPGVPFSPFKTGVGGPLGSGKQWMPWIHVADVLGLLQFLANTDAATGPINLVAPNPVTNAQFSAAIGRALDKPAVVPVPAFALKAIVGEFAYALLYSQKVIPTRAQALGYEFRFLDIDTALKDLL